MNFVWSVSLREKQPVEEQNPTLKQNLIIGTTPQITQAIITKQNSFGAPSYITIKRKNNK